jgi:hypothetical protein
MTTKCVFIVSDDCLQEAAELLDRSFEEHVPELQIYTYNRDGDSSELAAFGYNSIGAR